MFETSKDILYIVLAFCILWLTIFLLWLLFYVISIAKNLRWFIKGAKDNVANIIKSIDLMKEKIENSVSHLGTIADMAKNIVLHFIGNIPVGKKKRRK
ncbi:MAG: hypothetical protein V1661_01150 [bacterium]